MAMIYNRTHLLVWEIVHTKLISFQNIYIVADNIRVEMGTKKAITSKEHCMLDFAFGSATNIVTQTMSSMSF